MGRGIVKGGICPLVVARAHSAFALDDAIGGGVAYTSNDVERFELTDPGLANGRNTACCRMFNEKTTQVADAVHGNICVAPLEKRIISTEIFNRLHNILQTSTVYFTYPSNRTSRFSHSLGCLKVCTEIFRSGVLNASGSVRRRFLRESEELISRHKASSEFGSDLRVSIKNAGATREAALGAACLDGLDCPLYRALGLSELNRRDQYTYCLMLQAVRIAALLHDVGHPPLSHVTEYALAEIQKICRERLNNSKRAKQFAVSLNDLLPSGKAFHEQLGKQLTEIVLDQVIVDVSRSSEPEGLLNKPLHHKCIHDLILIKHLTLAILGANKRGILRTLYGIVSGDLDGDRLDYVQRDMVMSGLLKEVPQLDRLVQSFTLIEDRGLLQFAPSVRALSNLEDFFRQRFRLYKYVIYHHRVVKFDGMLQRCVIAVAEAYLRENRLLKDSTSPRSKNRGSKQSSAKGRESDLLLPDDISGLWEVPAASASASPSKLVSYYTQWDDPWLLGILRRQLCWMKARSDATNEASSPLRRQLDELLSNQRQYHSLFKRSECFSVVEEAFIKAAETGRIDWKRIEERALESRLNQEVIAIQVYSVRQYLDRAKAQLEANGDSFLRFIERSGYVLVKLFSLLQSWLEEGPSVKRIVDGAVGSLRQKYGFDEVLVMFKSIKPGVSRNFPLAGTRGEPVALGMVSMIAAELERECAFFPPFFVYLSGKGFSAARIQEYRTYFGQCLWSAFAEWSSKC